MSIVLDTNILLVILSPRSSDYWLFEGLLRGDFSLCVTTDILDEYAEIIGQKMNSEIAEMTIDILLTLPNTRLIHKYFFWQLVEKDPDDNKFIDCAIAAKATFLISEDKHLRVLKNYSYFGVELIRLRAFQQWFLQTHI